MRDLSPKYHQVLGIGKKKIEKKKKTPNIRNWKEKEKQQHLFWKEAYSIK